MRTAGLLFYLSILDESGWDRHYARAEVDVIKYMDRLIQQLEQAGSPGMRDDAQDLLTRHCNFWKGIREYQSLFLLSAMSNTSKGKCAI